MGLIVRLTVRVLLTHPDWTTYGFLTAVLAATLFNHYGVLS